MCNVTRVERLFELRVYSLVLGRQLEHVSAILFVLIKPAETFFKLLEASPLLPFVLLYMEWRDETLINEYTEGVLGEIKIFC